jgi:Phytanoyl-CoA dioxygenase (PhyH)
MSDTASLAQCFNALSDPALWRGIAPTLNVGNAELSADTAQPLPFEASQLAELNADLLREGYFQIPSFDWGLDLGLIATGVSAVVAAGHLPVFAFMYDEPWYMYARLRNILATVLDDSYMMMPAFWAWHVDGVREQAGWAPHRDLGFRTLLPDRRPKAMTFWLALSEATPQNGCMYVLPADRDLYYGTPRDHEPHIDLQNVRALPSPAGGLLAWTQAVFHWGARARKPITTPRISISVEFQRGDEAPLYEPLLDPRQSPDLSLRLRLILRQVLQYKHMYPLAPDLQSLAEACAFRPGPTPAFLENMKAK